MKKIEGIMSQLQLINHCDKLKFVSIILQNIIMELNDIGYNYLRALVDPFNSDPTHNIFGNQSPCTVYKSTKTLFGKVLGTGGVFIAPQFLMYNDQQNQIIYTNGTATVTSVPINPLTTTWTSTSTDSAYINNAPYPSSSYAGFNTKMHRLVSAAVKVKFTGKQDLIGGNVYPFTFPISYFYDGAAISQIKNSDFLIKTDFTNQEVCCFYVPPDDKACAYWRQYGLTYGELNTQDYNFGMNYNMGIFIEAQNTSTDTYAPFQIDVCCIWEVTGDTEKQKQYYPCDLEQFHIVLSLLNGPKAWVGSPGTLKLNLTNFIQRPIKSFALGGTLRQDLPLFYVLDLDKPMPIRNEAGDIIAKVSEKKAKAYITGDNTALKEAEQEEQNVQYDGGIQVYKGNRDVSWGDDGNFQTPLLEDVFKEIDDPTKSVRRKRRRSSLLNKTLNK